MSPTGDNHSGYTRRRFLAATLSIASGATTSLLLSHDAAAGEKPAQPRLKTYNGGVDPYPIPWLDKNGNHNQPARSWSHRTSIISKGASAGARISLAWAPIIKAIELRSAHPQPTTGLWGENTSPDALRRPERSLTYD